MDSALAAAAAVASRTFGLPIQYMPATKIKIDISFVRRAHGEQGGQLIQAIVKIASAFSGPIPRTKTDTGIIVVLDNRVLTKQYGQAFIDALPKCPVEIV